MESLAGSRGHPRSSARELVPALVFDLDDHRIETSGSDLAGMLEGGLALRAGTRLTERLLTVEVQLDDPVIGRLGAVRTWY